MRATVGVRSTSFFSEASSSLDELHHSPAYLSHILGVVRVKYLKMEHGDFVFDFYEIGWGSSAHSFGTCREGFFFRYISTITATVTP